jgi:hypothetical protein
MRVYRRMLFGLTLIFLVFHVAPKSAGAFAVQDTLHLTCPGAPAEPLVAYSLLTDPIRDVIHVAEVVGGRVAALDPWTRQIIACADMGGQNWHLALDAADRRLYVLQWNPDRILVLDADSYAVLDTLPTGPHGETFAIQPDTDKLYISNYYHDLLVVVDALSGAILSTIPIFHPGEPSVSRRHNRIYVPGWGGMLWVVNGEDDVIEDQRYIYAGICEPRLSAYDEQRDQLYVSPFNCPFLSVLDGATLETLAGYLELPGYPYRILADEGSGRAYVTAESSLAVLGPDLTVTEVLTLDGCYLADEAWHEPTARLFVNGDLPGPLPEQFTLVLGESQETRCGPAAPVDLALAGVSPFFDQCAITYTVGTDGPWSLSIHGLDGRLVRRLVQGAGPGRAQVVWDGTDGRGRAAPAGIYFCRLETGGQRTCARVMRLR